MPETPSLAVEVAVVGVGGEALWLQRSAVEMGRSRGVVSSFLCWVLRRLLELFVPCMRSGPHGSSLGGSKGKRHRLTRGLANNLLKLGPAL